MPRMYTSLKAAKLVLKKFWKDIFITISLHSQKQKGPLVKGLRRIPFTDESRVRFSYGLHSGDFQEKLKISFFFSDYFERDSSLSEIPCDNDQAFLAGVKRLNGRFRYAPPVQKQILFTFCVTTGWLLQSSSPRKSQAGIIIKFFMH